MQYFLSRLIVSLLLLSCPGAPLSAQPDTVKIGAFVNDIFDINLSDKSFSTQFWVWFNYRNHALQPLESLEIPNAKEMDSSLNFVEEKKGVYWASKKIHAIIKKDWDIRRFPFDEQKMSIEFEEGAKDVATMVYVPDTENTRLDSGLVLSNWEIKRFELSIRSKKYATSYGDPGLSADSEYSHASIDIWIKKKRGLFFSLFTGLFVAFFIPSLVFFIDATDLDPRFGLSVGGLFAAVGNKYIVDSILPQSTTFTLVDKIHILTYVFMLLCVVLSVRSLRIWKNGDPARSARFDRRAYFTIVPLYILLNFWLVYRSIHP